MSRVLYGNLDLATNQVLNVRMQMLPSDPSALEAQFYYNTTAKEVRYHNGTAWVALGTAGAGGPPSGAAGGDLTGSYPSPTIAAGVIVDVDVNASANIAQTKIAGLPASLTGKADTTTTVTAGAGLTGGGTLAASRTLDVGAGTGITVAADSVAVDPATVQMLSAKGAASGYAPLDASSKIPTAHLPPLAINDVFTVASQAAMLALTAEVGDMAIRTDTGLTYVLSASPASVLANWKEIMAAGAVQSVNGQTGVVTITAASLGAVPTTRSVIAGAGLTGGGTLAADATLNVVGDATLAVAADSVGVVSAPKWTTPRTVSLTGAVTGSVALDGSANVSIATTHAQFVTMWGALGITSPKVITHNMNTREVFVQVYRDAAPYEEIDVEVEHTTLDSITIRFNPVPAGPWRYQIMGFK